MTTIDINTEKTGITLKTQKLRFQSKTPKNPKNKNKKN